MVLIYTTEAAIARRLKGRLQIGGTASPFGEQVIDPDLITQIGEQVEARVNAKLKQIYKFPLVSTSHPELASIVEKMAIAELVPVYFSGNDSDQISNYGQLMAAQGGTELEAIASGDVQLDGELPGYSPASVVPNRSISAKRSISATERANAFAQETAFKKGDAVVPLQGEDVRF